MTRDVRIWHHGLVARWWAEFNRDGEDITFFRAAVERSGVPALDAGCGTGRLLLPMLRAGLDVDGSDASVDMLDWCRAAALAENLATRLYTQPLHGLDLPRRYRTIVVCGAFGLGTSRSDDLEGLRRLRAHLAPGGTLLMDHYLPNREHPRAWRHWVEQPTLPGRWSQPGDRRRAADGSELELRTRLAALDPLDQTSTLEIEVVHYVDGAEVERQIGAIHVNLYFKSEIELMLRVAGFRDVTVTGALEPRAPRPWQDQRIVFHATA